MNRTSAEVEQAIASRRALVGVIGLGYVGLPLAMACARAGFKCVGFDTDPVKIDALNSARSYIDGIGDKDLGGHVESGRFRASPGFEALAGCDVVIICVPTPLGAHREPDLQYVERTAETIARHLHPGQLIVLESTSYPGTTEEVVQPILEQTGMKAGTDFFLAFSPEREDPGNRRFASTGIPKLVAGSEPDASRIVESFYAAVFDHVVGVSSIRVAEAAKITENIFRAVNIALVNELKVIYDAMGIDVWEVIAAAATKPFGYMPFYPGPGLGGHCIPIDPFYLTWKSHEFGMRTRLIELAGEINTGMPQYVVSKLERALDLHLGRTLGSSKILVVGLAYKKNVSDVRESASLELIRILRDRGASVDYHDPLVPSVPPTRRHPDISGKRTVTLTEESAAAYDAVLIATDHDAIDYDVIAQSARLVVDTRNAFGSRNSKPSILIKA